MPWGKPSSTYSTIFIVRGTVVQNQSNRWMKGTYTSKWGAYLAAAPSNLEATSSALASINGLSLALAAKNSATMPSNSGTLPAWKSQI